MEKVVEMVVKAYIAVMGIEKWEALTDKEQHDVIMTMISDANKAIDRI